MPQRKWNCGRQESGSREGERSKIEKGGKTKVEGQGRGERGEGNNREQKEGAKQDSTYTVSEESLSEDPGRRPQTIERSHRERM